MSEQATAAEPAKENKLIVAVKLTGAQAQFVKDAIAAQKASAKEGEVITATSFCELAVLNEAEAVLGKEPPAADHVKKHIVFGEKGSRDPRAKALGLTTKEYKRRLAVFNGTGITPTDEMLKAVPPAPPRKKPVRKPKAPAAPTIAPEATVPPAAPAAA